MTERPTTLDISTEVAVRRTGIINSILTDGLKSAGALRQEGKSYFSSFDSGPREDISFRIIYPQHKYEKPIEFSKALESALYAGSTSVLPVMAERQNDTSKVLGQALNGFSKYEPPLDEDKIRQTLEPRISSAFLVVMNETMDNLIKQSKRWLFTSAKDRFMQLENIGKPLKPKISPDRLSHFIFPQTIWDEYQSKKANAGDSRIKLVNKVIERKPFYGTLTFTVPDYESALLEILEERKEPIWIHGVRLPTEQDMSH